MVAMVFWRRQMLFALFKVDSRASIGMADEHYQVMASHMLVFLTFVE